MLKWFSGSQLTGIETGTGRLIEEPGTGKSVSVPVPVPTFCIKPVPVRNRSVPVPNRDPVTIQFFFL